MKQLPETVGDISLWIGSRPVRGVSRGGTQVVTVTARSSGEGATTIAADIARAFVAQGQGRAVMIDLDPARSALPDSIIQNPIVASGDWNPPKVAQALFATSHGFDVLRIEGTSLPRSFDFGKLIAELRKPYDLLVFDAGPLQGKVLSLIRGVPAYTILVIDANRATVPVLERLKRELRLMQLRVDGVILNRADVPANP